MKLYTDFYAIDIGTSSIKALALKQASNGSYEIELVESVPLNSAIIGGDFTAPVITDTALFKQALSEAVKAVPKNKRGAVLGLPDRWIKLYLFKIEITENEKRQPEFLRWRIEKKLALPPELEVFVDYQVLDVVPLEQGYSCDVIAAAVKKDILELLSAITAKLKIEVMAFDTSSLAVFNLYEDIYPEKTSGQSLVNLHIGNETTVFKAYKEGQLIYERVIEVAGEEFSKIIIELDDCEYKQAENTKCSELFFPVKRADVSVLLDKRQRVERIFGNWLRELNITFKFYQRKFNIQKIPAVFITGGGALFEGLPVFLSEYLETSCKIFNPFENLKTDSKISETVLKQGPIFAPCLGLLSE